MTPLTFRRRLLAVYVTGLLLGAGWKPIAWWRILRAEFWPDAGGPVGH